MPTAATAFHELGGSFLFEYGFAPCNHLEKRFGNYGSSIAQYANTNGLSIEIVFAPSDGRCAHIRFGRKLTLKAGGKYLSGRYSDLAKRMGYELPHSYPLAMENEHKQDLNRIYQDLLKTLPNILTNYSLEDIEQIELLPYGALRFIQRELRRSTYQCIEVSKLSK